MRFTSEIYSNIDKEWDLLKGHEFGLINVICPAVTFVCNPSALQKLCNYIMEEYTIGLEKNIKKYEEKYVSIGQPGGICDMTHFSTYNKANKTIYDLSRFINNSTYDLNIREATNSFNVEDLTTDEKLGFQIDSSTGLKKISWKNGNPYGILKESNKKIQLKSLHFQGAAKKYMPLFYRGSNLLRWDFLKNHYKEQIVSFLKKK